MSAVAKRPEGLASGFCRLAFRARWLFRAADALHRLIALCIAGVLFSGNADAQTLPRQVLNAGHSAAVTRIEWSEDGRLLLTSSRDNSARLWHVGSNRLIHALPGRVGAQRYTDFEMTAAFAGNDGSIIAGNRIGLQYWSPSGGTPDLGPARDQSVKHVLGRSAGPQVVITSSSPPSKVLSGWIRPSAGSGFLPIDVSRLGPISLAVDPAGREVALLGWISCGKESSACGIVRIFDAATGEFLRELELGPGQPRAIAYGADAGDLRVTLDDRHVVVSGEERSLRVAVAHSRNVLDSSISRDGRWYASLEQGEDNYDARQIDIHDLRSQGRRTLPAPPTDLLPVVSRPKSRQGNDDEPAASQIAFSPDGRFLAVGYTDGAVVLWDVAESRYRSALPRSNIGIIGSVRISRDGSSAAVYRGDLAVVDLGRGNGNSRLLLPRPGRGSVSYDVGIYGEEWQFMQTLVVAPEGDRVLAGMVGRGQYDVFDVRRGRVQLTIPHGASQARGVAFSRTAKTIAVRKSQEKDADYLEFRDAQTGRNRGASACCIGQILQIEPLADEGFAVSEYFGSVIAYDSSGRERWTIPKTYGRDFVDAMDSSADGSVLAVVYRESRIALHDAKGKKISEIAGGGLIGHVHALRLSPDGKVLFVGESGRVALISAAGKLISAIATDAAVNDLAISPDGRRLILLSGGAFITFDVTDMRAPTELFRTTRMANGAFHTSTIDGRYDRDGFGEFGDLSWIMPDDPLRPLPAEIFARDYYEPGLLRRTLACREAEAGGRAGACEETFKPIRPLAELNRVQPDVRIVGVRSGDSGDIVLVEVEVSERQDPSHTNGKTSAAVHDVRLFRNDQLVGQWPDSRDSETAGGLNYWRQSSRVRMAPGQTTATRVFEVRLASRDRNQKLAFKAYAFNEDRVKSATASLNYTVPADLPHRSPKAFVITVGADAYQAPSRDLQFAVRDAEAMARALSRLNGYDVVSLTLTSAGRDQKRWQATRQNIQDVLTKLAGKPQRASSLEGVAGADRLARARPDDIVIVTFSGHGYTDRNGTFFLLPSDSGASTAIGPEALSRFISSDELSEWIRPIDAGQLTMIIDACHSAASVSQPGFKPGPMGDRGLGQLAYDKAMRILAATQADDVALESEKLKQGLLTYALVRDGLALQPDGKIAADINLDGRLTLAEWLRFGAQHTPSLFDDVRTGRRTLTYAGRDVIPNPSFKEQAISRAQTPVLFDFARREELPTMR